MINLTYAKDIIVTDPINAKKIISAGGYNGSDGSNGSSGSDGTCSYCEETDSYSSDNGSRGQDGEDGENGGDGKDVLIHYTDLSQIKDFKIYSYGGYGGSGGLGGSGGSGCNGGSDGNAGSKGKDGYNGSRGYLYLVPSPTIYTPNVTKHSSTINTLSKISVEMILNYWETKKGAKDLLATDSVVQDSYYSFKKVNKMNVDLLWDTNKNQKDYNNIKLSLNYNGAEIAVNFKDAFVDYIVETSQNRTTIIIKNIYKKDELLNFIDFSISGQRQNLKLKFKVNSSDLRLEDVKFGIEVFKKRFLSKHYVSIHDQRNANDLLEISNGDINISVGQLPIKSRHLKRKKNIEVNITMTVSVFDKTLYRTYKLSHRVGYPLTIIK
jgi:hypothetical protein